MPHDSTAQAARERADGLMTGFPPAPEARVTLANWQDPPYSRWAFRHMRELIPSQPIPAGSPAPLPAAPWPLPDPPVWRIDGSTATAAEVFADTYTDALVVLKDGQLVAERDMLGWVCGRAGGTRMADLIATLIWQPMGAERDGEITCDPLGSAIHDGGVSATARDLARFGQLLVDDGKAGGDPVVPAAWLAATRAPEPGVREAFAATDHEFVLPGGWYRNQFWVIPGPGGPVLVCLGIHGQL